MTIENEIYKPGLLDFLSRNDRIYVGLGISDYINDCIERMNKMHPTISGQHEVFKCLTPEAKEALAKEMHNIMLNGLTEEQIQILGTKKSKKSVGIKSPSEEHMKASKEIFSPQISDEDWEKVKAVAKISENAVNNFRKIMQGMCDTYRKKNHDYGNSFDKSLDEDGLVAAKVRIGDKFNRFGNLIRTENKVSDESLEDTLLDMANYCVMTVMWMRGGE